MKQRILLFGILAVSTMPAFANLTLDLGTPSSESSFSLVGWGPIEPDAHGGNWGGMGSGTAPYSSDQKARVVWYPGDEPWAEVDFGQPVSSLTIYNLDGIADDSFKVYVNGNLWGTYVDSGSVETWKQTVFSGIAGSLLRIEATGSAWQYFNPYGQLAIDKIEAVTVPSPTALLLVGIGTALVGWIRKSRRII